MNLVKLVPTLLTFGLLSAQSLAGQDAWSLKGFQCYALDTQRLHLSPDDVFKGKGLPPVFDAPIVGAKKVGVESEIIYVAWPLRTENGFTQILRANGQLAWIADNAIRPLRKADGTQGGCKLSQAQNGRITFALDPGVAVGN